MDTIIDLIPSNNTTSLWIGPYPSASFLTVIIQSQSDRRWTVSSTSDQSTLALSGFICRKYNDPSQSSFHSHRHSQSSYHLPSSALSTKILGFNPLMVYVAGGVALLLLICLCCVCPYYCYRRGCCCNNNNNDDDDDVDSSMGDRKNNARIRDIEMKRRISPDMQPGGASARNILAHMDDEEEEDLMELALEIQGEWKHTPGNENLDSHPIDEITDAVIEADRLESQQLKNTTVKPAGESATVKNDKTDLQRQLSDSEDLYDENPQRRTIGADIAGEHRDGDDGEEEEDNDEEEYRDTITPMAVIQSAASSLMSGGDFEAGGPISRSMTPVGVDSDHHHHPPPPSASSASITYKPVSRHSTQVDVGLVIATMLTEVDSSDEDDPDEEDLNTDSDMREEEEEMHDQVKPVEQLLEVEDEEHMPLKKEEVESDVFEQSKDKSKKKRISRSKQRKSAKMDIPRTKSHGKVYDYGYQIEDDPKLDEVDKRYLRQLSKLHSQKEVISQRSSLIHTPPKSILLDDDDGDGGDPKGEEHPYPLKEDESGDQGEKDVLLSHNPFENLNSDKSDMIGSPEIIAHSVPVVPFADHRSDDERIAEVMSRDTGDQPAGDGGDSKGDALDATKSRSKTYEDDPFQDGIEPDIIGPGSLFSVIPSEILAESK